MTPENATPAPITKPKATAAAGAVFTTVAMAVAAATTIMEPVTMAARRPKCAMTSPTSGLGSPSISGKIEKNNPSWRASKPRASAIAVLRMPDP